VDLRQVGGDFVVWKSSGAPAYQLAVVVDDAAMGVTEVVRGDDLVPSTPRQLLLYEALGLTPPRFAHVPLVVGPDGRRLAKRHGDTRLGALRRAGVRPEALVGLLAWSCGWLDRVEPITARDLLPSFRLDAIPRPPFVLTPALLKGLGYSP
jgi:glutamyl-tRNA synthetase